MLPDRGEAEHSENVAMAPSTSGPSQAYRELHNGQVEGEVVAGGCRAHLDPSTYEQRIHLREAQRLCGCVALERADQVFGSGPAP
jgi:hypothetical protein